MVSSEKASHKLHINMTSITQKCIWWRSKRKHAKMLPMAKMARLWVTVHHVKIHSSKWIVPHTIIFLELKTPTISFSSTVGQIFQQELVAHPQPREHNRYHELRSQSSWNVANEIELLTFTQEWCQVIKLISEDQWYLTVEMRGSCSKGCRQSWEKW